MIEFKFSCPNCNQHIQCTDAYSGMQIICPTCKNQIVVPPAPGSIPAKPASAAPSRPSVPPQAATANKTSVPRGARRRYEPRWGMICIAGAVLVFLGVIGYAFFSVVFSGSEKASSTGVVLPNAAIQKTANRKTGSSESVTPAGSISPQTSSATGHPNDTRTPNASEIIRRVIEQYESLTSYSARGNAVSIIDMSEVDPSKLPGMAGDKAAWEKNADQIKAAMSKPQRTENRFSLKFGRPDFYRVEWEGEMGLMKTRGAAWSSGGGDFILMEAGDTRYTKMKSREMALATATGISGGVANTMPQIFFKGQSSLLNMFKQPVRGDDESIDGEDCFVVIGNAMGLKVILWVNKNNFLIKQKQQVLGGNLEIPEMDDAQMEEGLKQLGGEPTEAQKTQYKETLKNMKALTSKTKGSMTETYRDIEINQPVAKTDFDYPVPDGTPLSESLFKAR